MIQNAGTQILTADGTIGISGKPIRIFCLHIVSGGTQGIVQVASGGNTIIYETGTANTGKTITFGDNGMFIPAGATCDIDANTVRAVVTYTQGGI
jgi:hypothetical protein